MIAESNEGEDPNANVSTSLKEAEDNILGEGAAEPRLTTAREHRTGYKDFATMWKIISDFFLRVQVRTVYPLGKTDD